MDTRSKQPVIDTNRIETAYNEHRFFPCITNWLGKKLEKDSIGVAQLIEHYTKASTIETGLPILLKRIAQFISDHMDRSKTLYENELILTKMLKENAHICELAAQLKPLSEEKQNEYVAARSEAIKVIKKFENGNKVALIDFVLKQAAEEQAAALIQTPIRQL